MGMTPELIVFCDNYAADPLHDRAHAAMLAWPTLARPQARARANQALMRNDVRVYIQAMIGEVCERVEITAEKIYAEFAKIAFASLKDCINPDGGAIELQHLPDHVAAALGEMEVTEVNGVRRIKVKLHSKLEALKALAASLKIATERREVVGDGGGPIHVIADLSVEEATAAYMAMIRGEVVQ